MQKAVVTYNIINSSQLPPSVQQTQNLKKLLFNLTGNNNIPVKAPRRKVLYNNIQLRDHSRLLVTVLQCSGDNESSTNNLIPRILSLEFSFRLVIVTHIMKVIEHVLFVVQTKKNKKSTSSYFFIKLLVKFLSTQSLYCNYLK